MKILQINKHAWPHYGGIERIVTDISHSLSESSQVDILCVGEKASQNLETNKQGTVYRAAAGVKLLSMPISFDFLKLAKNLIPKYDWVILHHPFPLGFLVYLLYGSKTKAVVWYHSDIVRQKFTGWVIRPLLKAILNRADKIIVSDLSIAKNSLLLKPLLGKVVAIPFAVDLTPYNDAARQAGDQLKQTFDKPIILSVGRLVYYKGHEYLIKAMAGLDAQLIIIGTGNLKSELLSLVESLNLQNVTIMEPINDLIPYYYASSVFVLPSIAASEAFGVVQLEAMAAAKPVINTDLPTGVKSVSLHGKTGLTVAPADVHELRNAIIALLLNDSLREDYGQQARLRIEQNFSTDQFAQKLLETLE